MWTFRKIREDEIETDPTQAEFFVNNDIDRSDALIRETIQNSLDAKRENSSQVTVRFSFHHFSNHDANSNIAQYVDGLRPHLQAARFSLAEVNFEKLSFLVVEDFGTHGLRGDPNKRDEGDFSYFWHRIGLSGKAGKSGGRWGLGKTVFPNSSQIGAFFGLTIRSDDRRALLMGQAVLRTHEIDGTQYVPYGFYSISKEGEFQLPFEEKDKTELFTKDCRLHRTTESGLSIVVPFPHPDISEESLIKAALIHYFYAIITGVLIVQINDKTINGSTIHDHAKAIKLERLPNFQRMFDFAMEAFLTTDSEILIVDHSEKLNGDMGVIPKEAFTESKLAGMMSAYAEGNLVAVRVPVSIAEKSKVPKDSYFDLFIKRDPSLDRGQDLYIRGGIAITGQTVFGARHALGILLAQDQAVSQFLGDSENPSHTNWIENSPRLSQKYLSPRKTLRFIRRSLVSLLDTLANVSEETDRDALVDFFFSEKRKDGTQPPQPPPPPPPPTERNIVVHKTTNGFKLKATPHVNSAAFPIEIKVLVAYDIRRGNSFKKYNPNDFLLNQPPINVGYSGVSDLALSKNEIEFTADAGDFEFEASGFDRHRDLAVRVFERGT